MTDIEARIAEIKELPKEQRAQAYDDLRVENDKNFIVIVKGVNVNAKTTK